MLPRIIAFTLCLCTTVCLAAAPERFTPSTEGLLFTLEGSNTIGAKLAPSWAQSWLTEKGATGVQIEPTNNENEYRILGLNGKKPVYIDIHAHGSTTGFAGLLKKTANIAMASRAIKSSEVEQLRAENGDMLSFNAEHVVAIDGLAVVVHPSNRINSLSVSQIQKIFSGEITNWADLGGAKKSIRVYARDDKSGTYDTFKSLVLQKSHTLVSSAERFESNDKLSDTVAADPSGIGFVGLASVRSAKALAVSEDKTLSLLPDKIHVATEDYPLSRRLFMYTPENVTDPNILDFLRFAQGTAGQHVVEQIGFVSQNPVSMSVADLNGPKEYRALSDYAERLSVNFRFQPGKANLDNKALHDIERLVNYIKRERGETLQIQLVGFSNPKNSDNRADVLSKLRASKVKIALFRNGLHTDPIMGFGSDVLVANDQSSTSSKNERVEVWLYNPEDKAEIQPKNAVANY